MILLWIPTGLSSLLGNELFVIGHLVLHHLLSAMNEQIYDNSLMLTRCPPTLTFTKIGVLFHHVRV